MSVRRYRDCDFRYVSEIYALSKLDELINEDANFELLPIKSDNKRLPNTYGL